MLPTCPACGQSVLDDDAVDCPFCGASMKGGKSGAKPNPQATKSAPAKKATEKKPEPKDEDLFGVGPSNTNRKAVALLAKPGKGKLHRIVCPMCETAGFSGKDAAGTEVRCSNPDCLMPIFTAPTLDGEPPTAAAKPALAAAAVTPVTPAAPAQKKSPLIPLSIGIVVVGGAIFGLMKMQSGNAKKEEQNLNQALVFKSTTPSVDPDNSATNPDGSVPGVTPVEPDKAATQRTPTLPSNDELRAEGFKRIVEFAADEDRNKKKDLCRRLTAELMAVSGRIADVPAQLKQLEIVGGEKYYALIPLAGVAWDRLQANDVARANEAIKQASELVAVIPPAGAIPLESAIEMASLFIATDRQDEAVKLINASKNEPELEAQVEAYLRAERTGRFNLDEVVSTRSIAAKSSAWSTVAFNLVMRGHVANAITWSKAAAEPQLVADSLAATAEALIASGGALESVTGEIGKLATAYRARTLARIAIAQHLAGKADFAKDAISQAVKAASEVTEGAPPAKPDMKGIYTLQLSDMTARVEDARSIAEVAHAQAVLGDRESAWTTIQKAAGLARATAPNSATAEQPLQEINTDGIQVVQGKLKSLLKLKSDDEARLAFNQYRKNAKALADSAANRMTLVGQLFEVACDWGLVDQVWTELQTRANSTDAATSEPWFDSLIPSVCEAHYKVTGQAEKATAIEQAVGADRLREKRSQRAHFRLGATKTAETNPAQAAIAMKDYLKIAKQGGDKPWQEEVLGGIASQLVAKGQTTAALSFAAAVDDPFTRQTLYELVASQATRKGDIQTIKDYAYNRAVVPPDRVAVLRGFLVNLPK